MKQISNAFAEHLHCEVTTLATCWKLNRRDGLVLAFTNHDKDIELDNLTYKAATGFTPSAIDNTATLSIDNLEIEGMLSDTDITEGDILAGKYDFAEIEIFMINYEDVSQGILKLKRGWLGEVSLQKQSFVAEVRGLSQRLSQTIGELFSPSCRASLGDIRCKVNLVLHTVSGSITGLISNQSFTDDSRIEASGLFTQGIIQFTSGANNGLSMEVKEYLLAGGIGRLELVLPMPFGLAEGDSYSLTKGCDKTITTCASRYHNIVNFRGEPHVPGLDRMLETAGTRSIW